MYTCQQLLHWVRVAKSLYKGLLLPTSQPRSCPALAARFLSLMFISGCSRASWLCLPPAAFQVLLAGTDPAAHIHLRLEREAAVALV